MQYYDVLCTICSSSKGVDEGVPRALQLKRCTVFLLVFFFFAMRLHFASVWRLLHGLSPKISNHKISNHKISNHKTSKHKISKFPLGASKVQSICPLRPKSAKYRPLEIQKCKVEAPRCAKVQSIGPKAMKPITS